MGRGREKEIPLKNFKLLLCCYIQPVSYKSEHSFDCKEDAVEYAERVILKAFKMKSIACFGMYDKVDNISDRHDYKEKPKTFKYWSISYGDYPAEKIIMKTIYVNYHDINATAKLRLLESSK